MECVDLLFLFLFLATRNTLISLSLSLSISFQAFTKDFLQEHGIPTAKYRNFTDPAEAIAYVESLDESDRQVVKASGLAAGKGVLIPNNKAETIAAIHEIMSDKAFGAAGDTCVIESFLTGPEASCFALCDGKTAVLMPAAQDHKRALDNDQGLNTGGMGAYAPAPCVTPNLHKEIEAMCIKTVEKMAERGTPYVGLLYAGMMYVEVILVCLGYVFLPCLLCTYLILKIQQPTFQSDAKWSLHAGV
jgi:phosphoribosylamine--glycine ligase